MKRSFLKAASICLVSGLVLLTACSQKELDAVEEVLNSEEIEQAVNELDAELSKTEEGEESKEQENDEADKTEHHHEIEKKKLNLYCATPENKFEYEFAFVDGADDIAYVPLETFKDIYVWLLKDNGNEEADLKIETNGKKAYLTRESGYPMEIDFSEDSITFVDYDAFVRLMEAQPLLDVIAAEGFNDKGEPEYFQLTEAPFERYGESITFRPGDYNIDLICQDGEYYLPLQLVSDIIFSHYSCNFGYNGKDVFLVGAGQIAPFQDLYYIKDAPTQRSDALIQFNYDELCFAMDNLYGLKEQHRIDSFDLLFKETGLYEPLMSKDPQVAAQALCDLLTKFFDDGHSGNYTNSYMVKKDPERHWGPTRKMAIEFRDKYKNFRDKAYPNGVEPYEEVGNTAFITFDEFAYLDVDYYGGEKPEDHLEDTVGLILYAYQQVSRDNSPIENIVMDLSNNGGGTADAAAFVLGAFLREGSISMMNPTTGALVSETFNVDLNLDRKFDEKDSFENFNLFCITSPNSFSCGNLVPSVFKSTFKVTLLGQQSAGGACVVHDMSSADGAFFKMSGCRRLAYMKNGSFYDIDQGVEPDYIISNPALFYDRKYIADFCDQVMGK